MILKSILRLPSMMIIIVVCTLVFLCFSSMQQLQQATALVLQDSLLEFNQNEDKNDYDEDKNLVYTNIVTSTSSNSESPSLLQTGSNKINFDNVMNLTNNPRDSVYGQVDASSENDVYIVWQDSVPGSAGSYKNYDIFFTKSSDAGTSFGREINLSNNNGFSEHPQLATSGNNVYVVWADNSFSANREIFFAKSTDGGNTFGNPINLSNNLGDSYNQEIFVFGDDIYVVWLDKEDPYESEDSHSNILIKSSIDGDATFGQTLSLSNNNNANANSFPKVAAYNSHVYVIWNVEENTEENTEQLLSLSEERNNNDNNTGLHFVKSSDQAASFGESIRVNHPDQELGEAQIAASGKDVYIVWGGSHINKVSNLSFIKSTDNGDTFSDPISITDNDDNNNNLNPSNVEISVDKLGNNNNVYIAWQSLISTAGQNNKEEILFKMSSDSGNTFGDTVNLSKNHDISECPSLTIYGGKVYVTWEDLSPGNHEILFTRSI